MAIAASTVPASASTVPASARATAPGGTAAPSRQQHLPPQGFHPTPGQSVRVTANGHVIPAQRPGDEGPVTTCLYHSPDSCLGVPQNVSPQDVHVVIETIHGLWMLWEILTENSDKNDNDGTTGGGDDPGEGLCLAAQGLDQQLTQTSCTATHGNFWQYQQAIKGNDVAFRLWNTEYHCYMTSHATTTGTWAQCSKINTEPWSTWAYYTAG
jgi:hypothetical protein